ncbi:general secretion pathway protein GspK [Candidatus Omnitrophota bacterium]
MSRRNQKTGLRFTVYGYRKESCRTPNTAHRTPPARGGSAFGGITETGSILILTLWFLFFLGMLGVTINSYVRPQLNIASKFVNRTKMHYLARAGVQRAIFEVLDDNEEVYDCLFDSWHNNLGSFKDIKLGDGTYSVRPTETIDEKNELYGLVDEESKINVNKVPLFVLANLFEIAGDLNSQDASSLAACIVDWRDEDDDTHDDGVEDDFYAGLSPKYPCKNADFEVLEELLFVKGMSQKVFNNIKDKITVYGEGQVNMNTAEPIVMQSLGLDSDLCERIVSFRKGGYSQGDEEFDNIFNDPGSIASTLSVAIELSNEEAAQINKAFSFGLFAVASNHFKGHAIGQLSNKDNYVSITFIYDRRNSMLKHWRES